MIPLRREVSSFRRSLGEYQSNPFSSLFWDTPNGRRYAEFDQAAYNTAGFPDQYHYGFKSPYGDTAFFGGIASLAIDEYIAEYAAIREGVPVICDEAATCVHGGGLPLVCDYVDSGNYIEAMAYIAVDGDTSPDVLAWSSGVDSPASVTTANLPGLPARLSDGLVMVGSLGDSGFTPEEGGEFVYFGPDQYVFLGQSSHPPFSPSGELLYIRLSIRKYTDGEPVEIATGRLPLFWTPYHGFSADGGLLINGWTAWRSQFIQWISSMCCTSLSAVPSSDGSPSRVVFSLLDTHSAPSRYGNLLGDGQTRITTRTPAFAAIEATTQLRARTPLCGYKPYDAQDKPPDASSRFSWRLYGGSLLAHSRPARPSIYRYVDFSDVRYIPFSSYGLGVSYQDPDDWYRNASQGGFDTIAPWALMATNPSSTATPTGTPDATADISDIGAITKWDAAPALGSIFTSLYSPTGKQHSFGLIPRGESWQASHSSYPRLASNTGEYAGEFAKSFNLGRLATSQGGLRSLVATPASDGISNSVTLSFTPAGDATSASYVNRGLSAYDDWLPSAIAFSRVTNCASNAVYSSQGSHHCTGRWRYYGLPAGEYLHQQATVDYALQLLVRPSCDDRVFFQNGLWRSNTEWAATFVLQGVVKVTQAPASDTQFVSSGGYTIYASCVAFVVNVFTTLESIPLSHTHVELTQDIGQYHAGKIPRTGRGGAVVSDGSAVFPTYLLESVYVYNDVTWLRTNTNSSQNLLPQLSTLNISVGPA